MLLLNEGNIRDGQDGKGGRMGFEREAHAETRGRREEGDSDRDGDKYKRGKVMIWDWLKNL